MWGAIVEKLDQLEHDPEAIDAETEDFDDEDATIPLSSPRRTTSFGMAKIVKPVTPTRSTAKIEDA
jgi:hypothetical protein